MTHDEIIAMAREAGMQANCGHTDRDGVHHPAVAALKTSVPVDWLARFADRVAAKEREACALVCDAERQDFGGVAAGPMTTDAGKRVHEAMAAGAATCAAAIRARGQKEGA